MPTSHGPSFSHSHPLISLPGASILFSVSTVFHFQTLQVNAIIVAVWSLFMASLSQCSQCVMFQCIVSCFLLHFSFGPLVVFTLGYCE